MNTENAAAEIFALLGRPVVLLKVARKTKAPVDTAWQTKGVADMTPAYLASLNGETNIGILHGHASGGLCGIEFDNLAHAKLFWNANPWAKNGLWSKAKRGPCFWCFIRGEYPENHDLYDEAGKHIGEWRADGRQTVFSGVHPEGMAYQNSGKPPAEIEYSEIAFPPGILTAKPKPEAEAEVGPEPETEPEAEPRCQFDEAALIAKCGGPFQTSAKGAIILNESYFVQRFCLEHEVIFERDENWFYAYRTATGAWHKVTPEAIKEEFRLDWEEMVREFGEPRLATKDSNRFINGVVDGIKSHAGKHGALPRLKNTIHCANGMLHLGADRKCRLVAFSPDYKSRNPIPVAWNAEAKAPKFEAILATLPADDAGLIRRYFANILLGGNPAQQVLLLVGEGGTSKSTLCELVELLLGTDNVAELRTKFLHERFEIGRYAGKMLLSGKDVPGNFLQTEGAQALKKLTGHDWLTGEVKFSMATPKIYGDFPALVTCNERLLVRLEGDIDVSAWARRLLMVPFGAESKHKEIIPNYAQKLIAEEGEGILFLVVQAAFDHLAELETAGTFAQTAAQKARVDALLAESQSMERFVNERIFKDDQRPGLATEEVTTAYNEYCEDRRWTPLELRTLQRKLPDLMSRLFGSHLSNKIKRTDDRGKDTFVRGYPHVALRQAAEGAAEGAAEAA